MTITFLGTGTSQGVPVIACDCDVCKSVDFRDKRTRSSVHIKANDLSLIIDTGPDFRSQVLRERIKWVDAIIFTHQHKDHTAGMDDIRSFNFHQKMDMPVYARKEVITQLKKEFSYIFQEKKYPGIPRIKTFEIENKPFKINKCEILPINVLHHQLPVFGFRIGNFTYITDANLISDDEMEKIKGSKTLVLNALQKEKHISHFTLDQAIEIGKKCEAEKVYFTHISHKMGKHRTVSKELPENMELAYDGLQLTI